jgi:hypothetical protein
MDRTRSERDGPLETLHVAFIQATETGPLRGVAWSFVDVNEHEGVLVIGAPKESKGPLEAWRETLGQRSPLVIFEFGWQARLV